jgi:hypothetical protein
MSEQPNGRIAMHEDTHVAAEVVEPAAVGAGQ